MKEMRKRRGKVKGRKVLMERRNKGKDKEEGEKKSKMTGKRKRKGKVNWYKS